MTGIGKQAKVLTDEDDDFCDHMDADEDILTGRLTCSCGYRKWLTSEESRQRQEFRLRAEAEWEAYLKESGEP